jgi:hypothetical protein
MVSDQNYFAVCRGEGSFASDYKKLAVCRAEPFPQEGDSNGYAKCYFLLFCSNLIGGRLEDRNFPPWYTQPHI